jgi:Domain of unknown function (DUF4336)
MAYLLCSMFSICMQGILYVFVPIRMTIVKIDGGLFVYAPIAPTKVTT